jgi:hypothetical protein
MIAISIGFLLRGMVLISEKLPDSSADPILQAPEPETQVACMNISL